MKVQQALVKTKTSATASSCWPLLDLGRTKELLTLGNPLFSMFLALFWNFLAIVGYFRDVLVYSKFFGRFLNLLVAF